MKTKNAFEEQYKDAYTNAVGVVHFSDESISDKNCLCFATETTTSDGQKWDALQFCSVFAYKSRIAQLSKDLSGVKRMEFGFTACESLQKLCVGGAGMSLPDDLPEDWETQNYSTWSGSFDNLIFSNCGFRNVLAVTQIDIKFPKLIRGVGDFYNCSNLHTLNTNFDNVIMLEYEFDSCKLLKNINLGKNGLRHLMYGQGVFYNCESLNDFKYELPILISGRDMFSKCKLTCESASIILRSLPEIKLCRSTNTTVSDAALKNVLTDAGLYPKWNEKMSASEPTTLAEITKEQNDYWWYYNNKKTGLKHIRHNYSQTGGGDTFIFYYLFPVYDYASNEIVEKYSSRSILCDDFGVISLGMKDDIETEKLQKEKDKDGNELLSTVIAKGWKIYINNTLQDAFYYGKEGKITIKEKTDVLGSTSSIRTIFTGTYFAYGARQKGKDGKLKIKISKTSGTEAITLTTDEVTIQPKSATNDDGSFNQTTITLIIKGIDKQIKVSSNKTTLSLVEGQSGGKYDIIFS